MENLECYSIIDSFLVILASPIDPLLLQEQVHDDILLILIFKDWDIERDLVHLGIVDGLKEVSYRVLISLKRMKQRLTVRELSIGEVSHLGLGQVLQKDACSFKHRDGSPLIVGEGVHQVA